MSENLLLFRVTLTTGHGDEAFGIFFLERLVTSPAIAVKCQLQILFLYIRRQFFLIFDGGLIMAGFTFLYGHAFFPDIFPLLIDMMAFTACDFMDLDMFFMGK